MTSIIFFTACESKKEQNTVERWYTQDMSQKGKQLYQNNCASCHGFRGQGIAKKWNEKMENGKYPPPPLNMEAHAWHHPLKALRFTIQNGGKFVGGVMPSFSNTLNTEQTDNVIAHFQDFWNDDYYNEWLKRGGLTK